MKDDLRAVRRPPPSGTMVISMKAGGSDFRHGISERILIE